MSPSRCDSNGRNPTQSQVPYMAQAGGRAASGSSCAQTRCSRPSTSHSPLPEQQVKPGEGSLSSTLSARKESKEACKGGQAATVALERPRPEVPLVAGPFGRTGEGVTSTSSVSRSSQARAGPFGRLVEGPSVAGPFGRTEEGEARASSADLPSSTSSSSQAAPTMKRLFRLCPRTQAGRIRPEDAYPPRDFPQEKLARLVQMAREKDSVPEWYDAPAGTDPSQCKTDYV